MEAKPVNENLKRLNIVLLRRARMACSEESARGDAVDAGGRETYFRLAGAGSFMDSS